MSMTDEQHMDMMKKLSKANRKRMWKLFWLTYRTLSSLAILVVGLLSLVCYFYYDGDVRLNLLVLGIGCLVIHELSEIRTHLKEREDRRLAILSSAIIEQRERARKKDGP